MNTRITKTGRVYADGKRVSPGWEKRWLLDNVYGWQWIGPGIYALGAVDLCVTLGEPNETQRAEIERRFADAKPPYNGRVFMPPKPSKANHLRA